MTGPIRLQPQIVGVLSFKLVLVKLIEDPLDSYVGFPQGESLLSLNSNLSLAAILAYDEALLGG